MINKAALALKLFIALCIYSMLVPPAYSASNVQTLNAEAKRMDSLAVPKGETVVSDKIASSFVTFSGSQENADSLISGLRNGTEIHLTTTASDGTVSSVDFTPPTGKMGYGNVFLSLSLAQQQLASQGFTQPSAEQLQAALMGGTVTVGGGGTSTSYTYQGVLQMRSDGMGWGQIANSMGVKLGQVVSSIKSANTQLSSTSSLRGTTGNGAAGTQPKISGSGTKHGTTDPSGRTSGVQTAGGKGNGTVSSSRSSQGGAGIVTATGTPAGGQGALSKGGGTPDAGVVSGAGGGAMTGAGVVHGNGADQGGDHGNKYGHGK